VFYFSGAAGNVDPCGALKADTTYTQARGRELADAVRKIQTEKIKKSNILRISNMEVRLPFRVSEITPEIVNAHAEEIKQWNPFDTWQNDVERWRSATLEKIAKGEMKNWLPLEIASVNIGGLVFFFSQGEPFNEYQTLLREIIRVFLYSLSHIQTAKILICPVNMPLKVMPTNMRKSRCIYTSGRLIRFPTKCRQSMKRLSNRL